MSERKVLNKYYPPDFDPSKIPKLRLPKNRQYSIRIMAPFNMRCNTCGEYIYKGKKFNSRKETVETEDYLGLKIFRFYIKCPRCVAEIAFKTDPQNTDYELEGGATRNFEAMRTAEILAKKEIQEKEQEEANNPMKVLENRTKASQQEMEMIETLEELRDLNSRNAKVDPEDMFRLHEAYEEQLAKLQDEEDENFINQIFGKSEKNESVKRLKEEEEDGEDNEDLPPLKKVNNSKKPTDFLTKGPQNGPTKTSAPAVWDRSVGSSSLNSKKALAGLVRRKPTPAQGSSNIKSTPTGDSTSSVPSEGSTGSATAGGSTTVIGILESSKTQGTTSESNESDSKNGAVTNALESSASTNNKPSSAAPSGLGLLGAYSDSDSDGST